MILASHNTFSYLKPLRWWLRPFRFMARCQSEDTWTQFKYGARIFDIRISFDKRHNPYFTHGMMKFKGHVHDHLSILEHISRLKANSCITVRVIKERRRDSDTDFIDFCRNLVTQFPHLDFAGGQEKGTWRKVFDFGRDIAVHDAYSSYNHDTDTPGTGTILDDWCPALYARRNNARHLSRYKGQEPLMLDFIGKYGWETPA